MTHIYIYICAHSFIHTKCIYICRLLANVRADEVATLAVKRRVLKDRMAKQASTYADVKEKVCICDMYVSIYVYVYVFYVCVFVCMCVCMYVCVYLLVWYIYGCVEFNVCICIAVVYTIPTCIHSLVYVCIFIHIYQVREKIVKKRAMEQTQELECLQRMEENRVRLARRKWTKLMESEAKHVKASKIRSARKAELLRRKVDRNVQLTQAFKKTRARLIDEQSEAYAAFLSKNSQHKNTRAKQMEEQAIRIEKSKQARKEKEILRDQILAADEKEQEKRRNTVTTKMNRELSSEWEERRQAGMSD